VINLDSSPIVDAVLGQSGINTPLRRAIRAPPRPGRISVGHIRWLSMPKEMFSLATVERREGRIAASWSSMRRCSRISKAPPLVWMHRACTGPEDAGHRRWRDHFPLQVDLLPPMGGKQTMVVGNNNYTGPPFVSAWASPLQETLPQLLLADRLIMSFGSMAVDGSGNLYVSDINWSRLMIFKDPFGIVGTDRRRRRPVCSRLHPRGPRPRRRPFLPH